MQFKNIFKRVLPAFILILFFACNPQKENCIQKPNIIIFFTDDQGYADVGCFGAKGFETPNLDHLAAGGIKFTNFYVPATVCTPSRAGWASNRSIPKTLPAS